MVLTTFRLGLLVPIKPLWKHLPTHPEACILNTLKLTMRSNHGRWEDQRAARTPANAPRITLLPSAESRLTERNHQELFSHLPFSVSVDPFCHQALPFSFTTSFCGRRSSFISSWKACCKQSPSERLLEARMCCTLLLGTMRKSGGIMYKPQSKVFLWIFKTLKNSWRFFLCIKRSSQPQKSY